MHKFTLMTDLTAIVILIITRLEDYVDRSTYSFTLTRENSLYPWFLRASLCRTYKWKVYRYWDKIRNPWVRFSSGNSVSLPTTASSRYCRSKDLISAIAFCRAACLIARWTVINKSSLKRFLKAPRFIAFIDQQDWWLQLYR